MSILIHGMEMPTGDNHITLFLYPDGKVVACGMLGPLGHYEAVPVPDYEKLLKVLKTERECVSRDCDRDCGKCDLSLDRDEIVGVYNAMIAMFDPSDKEGEGDG